MFTWFSENCVIRLKINHIHDKKNLFLNIKIYFIHVIVSVGSATHAHALICKVSGIVCIGFEYYVLIYIRADDRLV